jgi:hypothetical protein
VTQITVLRRGCPVCGSNHLRSWANPKRQDLLLSCDNRNHPHRVLLDGEVVSLRDKARAGGHQVMFYFTLTGHFEIPGHPRVLDGAPSAVPPSTTRSYDLDQVRAAAKAVLQCRGPTRVSLDDVTDVVVRLMRALKPAENNHDDCADVVLAVSREIDPLGASSRGPQALPEFQLAAE